MPKRSNDFQTLIKLIERQLAPKGASVTESKMLRDRRTGRPREVDIYIESSVGGHPVFVGIECTKSKKPLGIKWLEQLESKYRNLEPAVHKVVLVSDSGFYESVKEAASGLGFELLSLEEAKEADWVRAVNSDREIFVTFVRFIPRHFGVDARSTHRQSRRSKLYVHSPAGNRLGEMAEYCSRLLMADHLSAQFTQAMIERYDEEIGVFKGNRNKAELSFSPDGNWYLTDDSGQRFELDAFKFDFECRSERFSLKPRRFSYNHAQVASVIKELPGLKVTMTLTESEADEPTLGIVMEFHSNGRTHKQEIVTAPLPAYDGAVHLVFYQVG